MAANNSDNRGPTETPLDDPKPEVLKTQGDDSGKRITADGEYYASEEDNDSQLEDEDDLVFDPDAVDLRRLAVNGLSKPLKRAILAKKRELEEVIAQAIREQRKSGVKEENTPEDLVLGLLSVWVDEVPEYGEELLQRHKIYKGRREKRKKMGKPKDEQNLSTALTEKGVLEGLPQDDSPLATGMTALLLAITSELENSVQCVHALLEAGADTDARQPLTLAGPLHLACLSSIRGAGKSGESGVLDSAGMWSKARQSSGAKKKAKMSVEVIAKKAAKIAKESIDLPTSVVLNKIEMLCACGADPNARDSAMLTPLHAACLAGQPSPVIARLIAHGGDPNLRDKAIVTGKENEAQDLGWTPLHHLAAGIAYSEDSLLATAMELLDAGADPSMQGRWKSLNMGDALSSDVAGINRLSSSSRSTNSQTNAGSRLGASAMGSRGQPRATEQLFPDEIAFRLGKTALADLLRNPRIVLQAQNALAREEAARKERARIKRVGYFRGVAIPFLMSTWNNISRSMKTTFSVFLLLSVGFIVFIHLDMAAAAGAMGAMAVLAALALVAVKRESWIDQDKGVSIYQQRRHIQQSLKLE